MTIVRKGLIILGISTASALALALGCSAKDGDSGEASNADLSKSEDLVISQVYGGGGISPDEKFQTAANAADLIVAKQRNGPVGDLKLTFLQEITRFENFTQ